MGIRFRKSINLGPIRINISKSGVGVSFGFKGLRLTKKASGGFRATASIPGTGFSYVKDFDSEGKDKTSKDHETEATASEKTAKDRKPE